MSPDVLFVNGVLCQRIPDDRIETSLLEYFSVTRRSIEVVFGISVNGPGPEWSLECICLKRSPNILKSPQTSNKNAFISTQLSQTHRTFKYFNDFDGTCNDTLQNHWPLVDNLVLSDEKDNLHPTPWNHP